MANIKDQNFLSILDEYDLPILDQNEQAIDDYIVTVGPSLITFIVKEIDFIFVVKSQ